MSAGERIICEKCWRCPACGAGYDYAKCTGLVYESGCEKHRGSNDPIVCDDCEVTCQVCTWEGSTRDVDPGPCTLCAAMNKEKEKNATSRPPDHDFHRAGRS